jgi:hypothetical protein
VYLTVKKCGPFCRLTAKQHKQSNFPKAPTSTPGFSEELVPQRLRLGGVNVACATSPSARTHFLGPGKTSRNPFSKNQLYNVLSKQNKSVYDGAGIGVGCYSGAQKPRSRPASFIVIKKNRDMLYLVSSCAVPAAMATAEMGAISLARTDSPCPSSAGSVCRLLVIGLAGSSPIETESLLFSSNGSLRFLPRFAGAGASSALHTPVHFIT